MTAVADRLPDEPRLHCRVCGEPTTECQREAAKREAYYRDRFQSEKESGEWDREEP